MKEVKGGTKKSNFTSTEDANSKDWGLLRHLHEGMMDPVDTKRSGSPERAVTVTRRFSSALQSDRGQ